MIEMIAHIFGLVGFGMLIIVGLDAIVTFVQEVVRALRL
jgi:hypothetical protein